MCDFDLIKQRKKIYGSNFKNISEKWSHYLDKNITIKDVAHMMMLMKECRLEVTTDIDARQDTLVDFHNYKWISENIVEYENL